MTRGPALGFGGAPALLGRSWLPSRCGRRAPIRTPVRRRGRERCGRVRKPVGANVRIVLTVIPSTKKATVFWGKKKLGAIAPHQPLVVQRPRDSGPLDLVVRADGCVPVQTRAYTFADNKIAVKVTPLDQKNTLLGYREELSPDGGAPTAPPSPDAGAH